MADSTLIETPVLNSTQPPSNPWATRGTTVSPSTASCPWGKKPSHPQATSLHDVIHEQMSETLAQELQDKENAYTHLLEKPASNEVPGATAAAAAAVVVSDEDIARAYAEQTPDTSNDEEIAKMLQAAEEEKMKDLKMSIHAAQLNGSNKLTISYDKYKSYHPVYPQDEEEEDDDLDEVLETKTDWEKGVPTMGSKGFAGKGKNITTKHDAVLCGRRNAQRLMNDLPSHFETGDGEGMDLQLSNQVYNGLKRQLCTENKRALRLKEAKDQATSNKAIDPKTSVMMMKLINNQVLEPGYAVISSGKESIILYAQGGSNEELRLPKECAIKVFKTTLNEFRDRQKYVHGDHRFFRDDFKKQNPRKIIKLWAEKEQYNLNRMRKFDLPCPAVVVQKKHLLVMEFIGEDSVPAPKLKDAMLAPEDVEDAYHQTIKILETLYQACNLVHADFSEYNLLWFKDTVYVIDVSQAVDFTHPCAHEFLCRDCRNITQFFRKAGAQVMSPEELFNRVTGLSIEGEGALFEAQVRRCDKERRDILEAQGKKYKQYAFDFHFDCSQKQRSEALLASLAGLGDEDDEEDLGAEPV